MDPSLRTLLYLARQFRYTRLHPINRYPRGQCPKLRLVDCHADYLYATSQGYDYFHNAEHFSQNSYSATPRHTNPGITISQVYDTSCDLVHVDILGSPCPAVWLSEPPFHNVRAKILFNSHRLQLLDPYSPFFPHPLPTRLSRWMSTSDGVNGTLCDAEQYRHSYNFRNNDSSFPQISCLSHGESIGLAVSILPHQS